MNGPGPIVVFVGPTLPPDRCRALLDADYRPPAAQGDVYAAVNGARPSAIALIDGIFQTEPAVRHKELLWALHLGIPVYGAGSMGALRAAELAPCGMIGVGLVYRWYRRCPLAPDDAVAVAQAPAALGSLPLSTALIDLALTFRAARRAGLIGRREQHLLQRAAASLHYRERTLATAVKRLAAAGYPLDERETISRVSACAVSQKAMDAESLLSLLAKQNWRITAGGAPKTTDFPMTDAWLSDLQVSGQPIPASSDS